MADEPRRSVRATKGQHKTLELDQTTDTPKKRGKKTAVKKAASQEVASEVEEEEIIRCVCGVTEQDDDSDESWIACETCSAWQHNVCMGFTTNAAELEDLDYFCEQCKPEDHVELLAGMARGEKPWEARRKAHEDAELEASKAKKGKKGKGKRASDQKAAIEKSGMSHSPAPVDIKKEKKEVVSRAGSTKRKAADEPAIEPAKQTKARKVTAVEKVELPRAAQPVDTLLTFDGLDKSRKGPAELLYKSLQTALRNAQKSGNFTGSDSELDAKAQQLALLIERALHDAHQDSKAYSGQARKLFANLKQNQDLCNRLLSKSLTPTALAVMTDDQLQTKEFQQKTAEMMARNEKQSILVTDDGPRVRRTHKGEEVVEEDNYAGPSDGMPIARRRSMLDPNSGMGARSRENSPGEQNELPQDIDEYRSHDDIRGNAAGSPPTLETQDLPPPVRKSSTQVGDFDINKVFSSVQSPVTQQHPRTPSIQIPARNGPGEDADIDKMLEDGNESPPYSPAAYEDSDTSIVWRGEMTMNGVADFPAIARYIGGADLSTAGIPWTTLIPNKLQVSGRIEPSNAEEYLCGLRYSPHTDVSVLALSHAGGEAASVGFAKLFDYFEGKKKYAVVGNKGIATVRDTYLAPVGAGSAPIPEFLQNLEDGHKLPETRTDPLFLVAIVVRQQSEVSRSVDGATDDLQAVNQLKRQSFSGPAMSPIAPQGSFGSPVTATAPGLGQSSVQSSGPVPSTEADSVRRAREQEHRNGQIMAHQILGDLINAPTVGFLMANAHQMYPEYWTLIKGILLEKPEAQSDLAILTKHIAERGPQDVPK